MKELALLIFSRIFKGIMKYVMETINMQCGGDIYQFPYDNIKLVFKNHFRSTRKKDRSSQILVISSPSITIINHEIGSMLQDFKSEMFHKFFIRMETMQIKIKQQEEKMALAIICPRCTKRHPRNEFH